MRIVAPLIINPQAIATIEKYLTVNLFADGSLFSMTSKVKNSISEIRPVVAETT